MKPRPEDGSLEKITSSGLNSEFNAIIIQRTGEFEDPDGATYAFATLDRTREGVEWPGDQILEKLIPGLPKVKTPEVNKPDVTAETNSLHRHPIEKKLYRRPVQKNYYCTTTRRPKPPQKRFRPDRSENPSSFNYIDPWVCKPWENRTFFSGMNTTASVSATSLISTAPFNNFYVPTSASSQPFPPRTSNDIFSVPNSSTYEKNIRPTAAPNVSFINNHLGHRNRPPPTNRMPIGPHPSFPLPNRFSQHPDRGFCGPVPNVDFNGPSRNTGLLGETPASRYQVKHGLLGDSPFPNMPFNRNLVMFPNSVSAQSNPEGNTATLLPRHEENIGDKNIFTKNSSIVGSYDTGYGRIPRSNFDQYKDGNEISGQESQDAYEYPSNPDDSRNNSFKDTSEKNYSSYHNSGSSVNHYEDQYKDSYNHLDHNRPKDNNKNIISLKSSRDSHKTNYGRFEKPSAGVKYSKSGYKEVGDDNPCESGYKGSQISSISKTSTFMNNCNRNPKKDSLIHISNSAVVYNPEDFQNDRYPAAGTNSSTSRSNLNSVSRSNIRRNIPTKSTLGTKRRCTTNKFTNNNYYRLNRVKYNQGQQRFRKWKTPQK